MTKFEKRGEFFKAQGPLIYGWAVVCEQRDASGEWAPYVDTQGDHIPEAAAVDAAIRFAKGARAGKDMHEGEQVGSVPLVYVITRDSDELGLNANKTGIVIGWEPNDPKLLEAVARGERTGFSIGGMVSDAATSKRSKLDEEERANVEEPKENEPEDVEEDELDKLARQLGARVFRTFDIDEISTVDRPAMTPALIGYVKRQSADAAVAAERARVEAQLAEMAARERRAEVEKRERDSFEKRITDEMHSWLDDVAERAGVDAARSIAKLNENSAAKWGATWLAKRDGGIEKAAGSDESPEQIYKRRKSALDKALAAFEVARETFSKVAKLAGNPTGDFLHTAEGRRLYAAYSKAHDEAVNGNPEQVIAPLTARIDELTADLDAEAEKFALAHNLTIGEAKRRLPDVSPTYAAKLRELSQVHTNRSNTIAIEQAKAAQIFQDGIEAERRAKETEAEKRRRAALTPAERQLEDHVAELAKSRGESTGKALTWALRNDPTAKALYSVANEERLGSRRAN